MTTNYTEDHEWVRAVDGLYVVGITDYAQEQLGEIVYVELPEADAAVRQGEEAAVVESVKAAGEVKSPLSGTVVERNERLADAPELVNDQPEGDGWFYKMRVDDADQLAGELKSMMDADAYQKFVAALA